MTREELRSTFDEVAELYEEARPGYPDELFDDLAALGGLAPGSAVLEIGCGTGQATRSLAGRGYEITCVELGERLAAVAARTLAEFDRVRVVTADFEAWDSPGATFDLVFAATSWHWLDPEMRYARAAALLRPGGALAIVATKHVLLPGSDRFLAEVQDVYESVGEGGMAIPPPEDVEDDREEIEGSAVFGPVAVRRYLVEVAYTADEYVALLETFSGHRAMEEAKRSLLYEEIHRRIERRPGRRVRKAYLFILHVAGLPESSPRSASAAT